ncbi:MAG: ABC transporter substrate-binding protein [Saccharofermentanales bacterium]
MKKTISLILAIILAMTVLTACGPGGTTAPATPTGSPSSPSKTTAKEQPPAEDISLRFCWWGAEARHKATLATLDLYHSKNPNITIVGEYSEWSGYLDKLLTQLASGTAPDIIQVDNRFYFDLVDNKNVLVDLKTVTDKIDLSGIDKDFLDNYCTYKGFIVGAPTGINGLTLLFNKALFKKHNIPEDTVWTWDNLIEIGERVHQEDPEDYLFIVDAPNLQLMLRAYVKQQIGTQLVNEDYTLNVTKESLVF